MPHELKTHPRSPDGKPLKLQRTLPANRTYDQIKHHYEIEKALAERLKRANRQERGQIYGSMYGELFEKVPDHPRLTRRASAELTLRANRSKLLLVRPFLTDTTVFAEFAPGDCCFAIEVARRARSVYGIDISDQRGSIQDTPQNFQLIVYDGYNLSEPRDSSVDVVFSDDFVEHLHPRDTRLHFELAYRLLKKGGVYVFRTPHAYNGPHDISKYFSKVAEGFHLKEWTYRGLHELLGEVGFSKFSGLWNQYGLRLRLPFPYFSVSERLVQSIRNRRRLVDWLLPTISAVAVK